VWGRSDHTAVYARNGCMSEIAGTVFDPADESQNLLIVEPAVDRSPRGGILASTELSFLAVSFGKNVVKLGWVVGYLLRATHNLARADQSCPGLVTQRRDEPGTISHDSSHKRRTPDISSRRRPRA
jgi:hypothetical protein